MDGTTERDITGGRAGHSRALVDAVNELLKGVSLLGDLADAMSKNPNYRPQPGVLDWLGDKVGGDAVRVLDVARSIERAGQAVGVQS